MSDSVPVPSDCSSEEDTSEEDYDYDYDCYADWKDDLATCLDTIETAGDFAASKTYSAFVNPGLTVPGSSIPLPLTSRDAQALRGACRQAPYGKGEATLVDESVRKTWELSSDQFSLANPDWNEFVNTLLRDVAKPLGMTDVRADLYKLLLYEEGSFFKKHKDSEKAPGMVGTLVICLPAKHEGGDVHLTHAGRNRVFTTSQSSAFSLTAFAWFSDVTHEIMQVTSGYRLVLTYNIIQTKRSGPFSAGSFAEPQKQLESLIHKWKVEYTRPKRLLYCLDHKYTSSSLSLNTLKGRDRAVCQTLYDTCLRNGFYLLLANLTYSENDGYYDDDENVLTIDSLYSYNGSLVAEDFSIDVGDVIGDNPYEGRDPDSVSEGEYTGNEGMAETHRYHDTAAMVVSRHYLLEIWNEDFADGSALYWVIQPDIADSNADRSTRKFINTFITAMLESSNQLDKAVLSDIYRWGVKLKRNELLRKVIRKSIAQSETDELLITIAEVLNETFRDSASPQPEWNIWLDGYVLHVQSLTDLSSILRKLGTLLVNNALKKSLRSWRSSVEEQRLQSQKSYEVGDVDFIDKVISKSTDLSWIRSNLTPKLVERGSKPFLYLLVGYLLDGGREGVSQHAITLAKEIVEAAQEKLVLDVTDFSAPQYALNVKEALVPLIFTRIIGNCLKHGFTEQVEVLLNSTSSHIMQSFSTKVSKKAAPKQTVHVDSVEIFLQALAAVLQEHKMPPLPAVADLFETLMRRFIIVNAPSYPKKLSGWTHKPRGCKRDCRDCEDLDKFLRSADEKEGRFSMAEDRRKHLASQLLGWYSSTSQLFRCTTEKSRPGMAHTLIVTKLHQGKEFQDDVKQYRLDLSKFEERVRPLRQDYVEQLMGEARYRELVMLENLPDSEGGAQLAKENKKRKLDEPEEDSKPKPKPRKRRRR